MNLKLPYHKQKKTWWYEAETCQQRPVSFAKIKVSYENRMKLKTLHKANRTNISHQNAFRKVIFPVVSIHFQKGLG